MDYRDRSEQRSPRRDDRNRDGGRHRRSHRRDSRSKSPDHRRHRASRDDRASLEKKSRHGSPSRLSSHRHRETSHHARDVVVKKDLPYSARPLSKRDLPTFEPLFAHYLSLQKQKEIDDMDDREVRGRWKSFVGKWNRGELAEGWYDPEMFQKITMMYPQRDEEETHTGLPAMDEDRGEGRARNSDGDDDDDDYGPVLPPSNSGRRSGPGIPTVQDLSLRAELDEEDRHGSTEALRAARKVDRKVQKERLEELVPRAEPGTRERMLEKRQMVNDKMREFREKSPGMEAGDEKELMGGGDELQEYRRMKEREQRKKSDREIRREEVERAKREEMEERRRAWKEREEGTVGMLRELAKQRFG